ncbi:MAG: lipopolysaccharide transport periplasmic protein LptA [Methylophaga sp.]|nr:MAG: lipopolysaccharide transport periplasmic protein LptA [Methylophaga sp.]
MLRLVSKLLFISLISVPFYALALSSDREQPIEIEADHAQLDDEQGITQYKGKAILTQGTLRIEGDIITFYYDDDKQLTKAVAQGKRATYEQIQKAGEAPIRAKAYTMEYHARTQKIYLIGKGHVWQNGSEFSGERIEYDIDKNIVNASGRTNHAEQPKKGERIHIIIQPPGRSKKSSTTIVKPKPVTATAPTETAKTESKNDSYPTAITTANLNVRTGPSTQYNKLGVLNAGSELFILTEQQDWVQVRGIISDQVVIGWVHRRYIQLK